MILCPNKQHKCAYTFVKYGDTPIPVKIRMKGVKNERGIKRFANTYKSKFYGKRKDKKASRKNRKKCFNFYEKFGASVVR